MSSPHNLCTSSSTVTQSEEDPVWRLGYRLGNGGVWVGLPAGVGAHVDSVQIGSGATYGINYMFMLLQGVRYTKKQEINAK
jgi:hypothetical protein